MVSSLFGRTAPMPIDAGSARDGSAPGVVAAAPATSRKDLSILGVVGVELADSIATMQYVLQEYARRQSVSESHMRLLQSAVQITRRVGMQSQQIARLAHGKLRQSHERLSLNEMLEQALEDHAAEMRAHGVEVTRSIRPIEVIVDPGLLVTLLNAAVGWASGMGTKLMVTLDMKNWPEHGVLFFKIGQRIVANGATTGRDNTDGLGWHLLCEAAQVMGVSVDRVQTEAETILMLEFPRTVKRLEGMSTVEVETGYNSLHSEPHALAGHRLLVVTNDEKLRFDIRLVAKEMKLEIDSVDTPVQAVRICELDLPHMIVIDERVRNRVFDELRADLIKNNPNFPFLEIAIESNTLEMAGWMSESMARVSRDSLRSQLPSILALELARNM